MNKRVKREKREGINYWLSYSDIMAALILVFSLIIMITMLEARLQIEEQIEENIAYGNQLAKANRQIDEIVGVRTELIEALKKEFGDDANIDVDQNTGDIMFSSKILFDVNKSSLKPEGEIFLKSFFPRYFRALMNSDASGSVSEIIIEGHTDTTNTYLYNLALSQERAYAVASYCLDTQNKILKPGEIAELEKLISANGKSYSNPKYKKGTANEIDMDASRRVEIKFRLVEEEQIRKLSGIINDVLDDE